MAEEDKDQGKHKFTIPIWAPVILLIATIIHLFASGKSLLETIDMVLGMLPEGYPVAIPEIQAMVNNNILNSALHFVGLIMLYVFLWAVLNYIYKATGNKLFSRHFAKANT